MSSKVWFNLIPLIALNLICCIGFMVSVWLLIKNYNYNQLEPSEEAFQQRYEHLRGLPMLIDVIFGIIMIASCIIMSSILINRSIRLLRQHKRLSLTTLIVSVAQIIVVLPLIWLLLRHIESGTFQTMTGSFLVLCETFILMSIPLIISIVQVWAMTMIPVDMKGAKLLRSLLIGSSVAGILAYWWLVFIGRFGLFITELFIDAFILGNEYKFGNSFFEELISLMIGLENIPKSKR